ncbi:hypothetical protein EGM70_16070 [Enterobacteriaceae bacterium 89]|nr:hypothetical protein [Enterobacteriaceae bacterium 89]
MINTFTLTNPIFSAIEALLTRINQICSVQGISFFIAGATAREILLHHVHGRRTGRRTRDIDIAVYIENWQQFDALRAAFVAEGALPVAESAHRLMVEGIELDMIPFGDVAEGNRVLWPPEHVVILAVDGFADVFSHSVIVTLDNGVSIPFCSLAGLALLKLFAWRDRGRGNAKDAVDLFKIICEYGAIHDERIYESNEGEGLNWDPVRMGAVLLGSDMARISVASTLDELKHLDRERLTDAIVRQADTDELRDIEALMNDFWNGVVSMEFVNPETFVSG